MTITVKDFYSIVNSGQKIYYITDDKNELYIIEYDMIISNDVNTLITKIIQGNKYHIQCYGINYDVLGLHQKIIKLEYA